MDGGAAPRPRVAHVLCGETRGGAERFFVKLCLALQRRGWDQLALVSPDPQRVAELRAGGVQTLAIPFRRGVFGVLDRPRVGAALRRFGAGVALCTLKRAVLATPRGPWALLARVGGYYDMAKYRRCDMLVANTPDIAADFARRGWPADRIATISSFAGLTPAPPAPRAALATPADAPLILGVGRLHRVKGWDVLLQALPALPRAALWLAGDGPERGALERQAQALGVAERVRFLGWRDDAAALFAAADVVAVPSRHEPLGNVVIEAFSLRRPVVAAAVEGPSWLIRDGDSGLLVPAEDAAALAAALSRVLNDPALARRLAEGGRARYAEDFAEDAICARYDALFRATHARRAAG